jgi:hypothetical protein
MHKTTVVVLALLLLSVFCTVHAQEKAPTTPVLFGAEVEKKTMAAKEAAAAEEAAKSDFRKKVVVAEKKKEDKRNTFVNGVQTFVPPASLSIKVHNGQ